MPLVLTEEQIAEGLRLRASGETWKGVARRLGLKQVGTTEIHEALDPGYRELRLQMHRSKARSNHKGVRLRPNNATYVVRDIPAEVIADRDRRLGMPAPMLGDPPPGRSALDQINARSGR